MAEMEDELLTEPKKIIATKSWTVKSPNDQTITLEGRVQVAGTNGRVGFFGTTPAVRQGWVNGTGPVRTVAAYTSDPENVAYSAADVAALLVSLNALRVAYENLRVSHESLRTNVIGIISDLRTNGLFG